MLHSPAIPEDRPAAQQVGPPSPQRETSRLRSGFSALERFLLSPASALPLASLRIGLAVTLLLQAYFLAPHFWDFYGSQGILQGHLSVSEAGAAGLDAGGWVRFLSQIGVGEPAALGSLGGWYLLSLVLFLLGWKTRLATASTWLTHLLLTNGQATPYGLDQFAHMSLFLLIWSPSGAVLSLDALRRSASQAPSSSARLSLRVFQIFLCIAYLFSGLEKAAGMQWWTGEAIWRSLMLPSLAQFDMTWLAEYPWIPRVAAWSTLLLETGYPIFIWPHRTRGPWLLAMVGLHLGIAVFLGLWLFGLIMIVLNVALFGVPLLAERRAKAPIYSGGSLGAPVSGVPS